MISSALLALVLSQNGYIRSKVSDTVPNAQCLWWKEDTTIVFEQSVDGNPETGDSIFGAVARGFATWQTQLDTCGSLVLQEGPRTHSRTIGYDEHGTNQNVIIFRERNCTDLAANTDACWDAGTCDNMYDCWDKARGAIAITTTSYNPQSGRIFDSDIELNVPPFIFTTVDSPVCVAPNWATSCVATDVQNTITHEVGHLLGLAHYPSPTSTMNAHADPGELLKRVLDPGSKQFICDAYPKGAPSKSCVIAVVTEDLGKAKTGCSSVPVLLGWPVVVLALRRRRRS